MAGGLQRPTTGADWWRESGWLLAPVLGCGLFTWVGFLYIGLRARHSSWLWAAGLHGAGAAVLIGIMSSIPEDESGNIVDGGWQNVAGPVLLFGLWGAGIVHGAIAHRGWRNWYRSRPPSYLVPMPQAFAPPLLVPAPVPIAAPPPARWVQPPLLQQPWLDFVRRAEAGRDRFRRSAGQVRPGPLRDTLWALAGRIDTSVDECRRIASSGDALTGARQGIDTAAVDGALGEARARQASRPNDQRIARTIAALEAQRSTAARIDHVIEDTLSQLRLLDARLGEAVARMLELSAHSGSSTSVSALSSDVDVLVTDLEALRLAVEETHAADVLGSTGSLDLPGGLVPPGR